MFILPSLTIKDIEEMSLLEIDQRLRYIGELKLNKRRHDLKELSIILFSSISSGYTVCRVKEHKASEIEKSFHKSIDSILGLKNETESESNEKDVEKNLSSVFG